MTKNRYHESISYHSIAVKIFFMMIENVKIILKWSKQDFCNFFRFSILSGIVFITFFHQILYIVFYVNTNVQKCKQQNIFCKLYVNFM